MEYNCTINGIDYNIGEVPYGEYAGKWVWSNEGESRPFDTAAEAQQDAMIDAMQRQWAAEEQAYDNRPYRMSDAEWDFKNSRL